MFDSAATAADTEEVWESTSCCLANLLNSLQKRNTKFLTWGAESLSYLASHN